MTERHEMESGVGTASAPSIGGLAGGPLRDLGAKPEFHPALAEVDHRAGHVGVAVLVDAHSVVACDAEDLGDPVSVNEIVDDNRPRHAFQITSVLGGETPRGLAETLWEVTTMSAYATAPLGRSSLAVPLDLSERARAVPRVCSHDRTQGPTAARASSPSDGVLDALISQIAEQIAAVVVAQLAAARPDDQDEWLDSRRAAEYLGVHRDTLRKLAAERSIPAEQDGRGCKLFFRRVDLNEWRRRGRPSHTSLGCARSRRLGDVMADHSAHRRHVRVESNIYRRASGAYEVGFRDASGKQRWRTIRGGITAARAARNELLAQRGRGERPEARTRLRFLEAAEEWLEGPVRDLRPRTDECYRNAVNTHLLPRFGTRRLDAISPDDLAALVRELRAAGLSESTIVIALGVVNRIYRFAARRLNWHGTNPVSVMLSSERPKPAQSKRRRIFEGAELEQTIAAAAEPYRTLFTLAALTGARVSELLGLTWTDVRIADLDDAEIEFAWQVDRHGQRHRPRLTDPHGPCRSHGNSR
jgi:excisionase family DNA binding protein